MTPIGIFDSGYGGLTVMKEILKRLPGYDYLYLGDNARAPYGPRSFDTVYRYTLEAVRWFFDQGCPLVILACNTASAKALRSIQQRDLPHMDDPSRRVLGVIRPTAELIGQFTRTGEVGVLGTTGTVLSESYPIEIHKFFPGVRVWQQACPMWVPLVENGSFASPGADYFVRECLQSLLSQSPRIDTLLLACTHYPLLLPKIREQAPDGITIISQGEIVADSLASYLDRHPEMEERISRGSPKGSRQYFTTDATAEFDRQAAVFLGEPVQSAHVTL